MLFISLIRKYKVIRQKVPFILQLTNYPFITTRNTNLPVKLRVDDVQMPEQFSACYINLTYLLHGAESFLRN